jgi:hypothetical protein
VQVVGRLSGSHKAGITTLLTLPSRADFKQSTDQQAAAAAQQQQQQQQGVKGKTPRQSSERGAAAAAAAAGQEGPLVFLPSVDLVLAGDSSGSMFLWSPFSTPLGSAEREVAPRLSFTGHSGEVWALCLTPGPEDPRHTAPKVFSAGVPMFRANMRFLYTSSGCIEGEGESVGCMGIISGHCLLCKRCCMRRVNVDNSRSTYFNTTQGAFDQARSSSASIFLSRLCCFWPYILV